MKNHRKLLFIQSHRKGIFLLVLILQFITCSLWAQEIQKKALTVADYSKWGYLGLDKINVNGQWVCYTISYENGLDTLFIKNTKSLETHTFPLGGRGNFIAPDWFTCETAEGLNLLNLKTGKKETIADVSRCVYVPVVKRLLILIKKEKENTLIIREPGGAILESIAGVNEFVMDPANQMLLYTTTINNQHTINLLKFSQKNQRTILLNSSGSFSNLVWHISGNALAFMQKDTEASNSGNTIFYYHLPDKKLYSSAKTTQGFLRDSLSIPANSYKLKISDDMQRVFFAVQRRAKSKDSIKGSNVQVWDGNAKWLYPKEEAQKSFKGFYLALWRPFEDHYQLISNDTLPQFMLTGDQKYAILSNPKQYEPQYVREGPRDFYLVDLSTGKSKLLLRKHPDNFLATVPSPTGKYISYFHQKDWWIYDIAKNTHTSITKNIGHSFLNSQSDFPQNEEPYSNLGWTIQDKEILLCDEYDIWAISPDGSSTRRLTHGRETQTKFRLASFSGRIPGRLNYNGWIHDAVDLNKGLLLKASNEQKHSGYYKCTLKSNQKLVFSKNSRLDQLIYSASGDTFVYLEQRYDLSPRLMVQTPGDKAPRVVIQTNLQQQKFHWGKSELIEYKNAKGKSLQGVLYYPADYNNQKKYPMIVLIYQKLSQYLHSYTNPSQLTGEEDGFNISTFTTQGYFVLTPDISYEIGDPGVSATDCVVSATNKVIAQGLVLPDKIGLIGHSFGGYETDFIITQTNLFAAAVAGSAVTDLTSHYLSVGLLEMPNIYRFETSQFRIGKSLFEDWTSYTRNSPIVHAKNITTPLLAWTGDADINVESTQSIEFYLALRRLGKQHMMLLYPKEGHSLENSQNQKDLSTRIHQWFDHYLKDVLPAPWIKSGVRIGK